MTWLLGQTAWLVSMLTLMPLLKKRLVGLPLTRLTLSETEIATAHVDCPGHADYVKNMITGAP